MYSRTKKNKRITTVQTDNRGGSGRPLLLESLLLSDLPETIRSAHDIVYTQLYADDAVLYTRSRTYLKRALQRLENYSTENGLRINVAKTKIMKFGKGGPPASGEPFRLYGEPVERVSRFSHLGFHLSRQGISCGNLQADRIRKAKLAFSSIPKPWKLSLDTAIAFFEVKISPIAA